MRLYLQKKIEQEIDRFDLLYKTGNEKKTGTDNFPKLKTIRSSGREIYDSVIILHYAFEKQMKLKNETHNLN